MANTTNFNWETTDDTDLVKDGAAAIRTLGSAIDTSLVDLKGGTTGQVLSKATNTDMDFTWVSDATGIPATIFDAKGDIIAATAADTASRLAVGTNGNVLTVDSTTATGLKWAAPAGGGKVLQVVSATTTSTATINSTTFTDSNLTATITPTLSTSKILVLTTQSVRSIRSAADTAGNIRLVRDSTAIYTFDNRNGLAFDIQSSNITNIRLITSITYLDSPATTSATTYKIQGNVAEAVGNSELIFQNNSIPGSIILLEIGA